MNDVGLKETASRSVAYHRQAIHNIKMTLTYHAQFLKRRMLMRSRMQSVP